MNKLTNYEKHLQEELKNKESKQAYEKEYARLKFAYLMATIRKQRKISQKRLAERLGTTQSVVARMETGEQNFTIDTLQKIAGAFQRKLKVAFI